MRIILTLTALLLLGCSAERRCARAAKRCAAQWKSDTVQVWDSVVIRSSRTDTVLNTRTMRDTVTIRQGLATVRIIRLSPDSIYVQGECRDTVVRYIRQVVTNRVNVRPDWWVWVLVASAGLVIGWVIRRRL